MQFVEFGQQSREHNWMIIYVAQQRELTIHTDMLRCQGFYCAANFRGELIGVDDVEHSPHLVLGKEFRVLVPYHRWGEHKHACMDTYRPSSLPN